MTFLAVNTLTTRGGRTIPFTSLGLGGGTLGRLPSEEAAWDTVREAWSEGVRYFDTAPLYGRGLSERRVGSALAGQDRNDFILSTKVGLLLEENRYDYSHDAVMRSFEASLGRLGLGRIDILLVHDIDIPTHGSEDALEAHLRSLCDGGWRALDDLRRAGVVQAIGAGLNEWQMSERLLTLLDPDLFLLAGRYTLLEQGAVKSFLPACSARGAGVLIGGPLNSGLLAGRPGARARYNYAPAPAHVVERARALHEACRQFGVELPRAALQFPLAHPGVLSVISGASSGSEIRTNAGLIRKPIPAGLWQCLLESGLLDPDAPTPLPTTGNLHPA